MPWNDPGEKGEGWKSPPAGWSNANRDGMLLLRAYAAEGTDELTMWSAAPGIVAAIQKPLGAHPCVVAASSVNPAVWERTTPWEQADYGFRAKCGTNDLATPDQWRERVMRWMDCPTSVQAFRGGGANRHAVWTLTADRSRIDILLALRHVHPKWEKQLHTFIVACFRAVDRTAGLWYGSGDFFGKDEGDCSMFAPFASVDRYIADSFASEAWKRGEPVVPGARPINALGGEIVKRLGGHAALAARMKDAKSAARPDDFEASLTRLKHGSMLRLGGSFAWLFDGRGSLFSAHPVWVGPAYFWLQQEFHAAGLLAGAQHNMFDRYMQQRRADAERARVAVARNAGVPLPSGARRSSKHAADVAGRREQAPSCIRGVAERTTALPGRLTASHLDGHTRKFAGTIFRVRSGDMHEAMAIYGRNQRGEDTLGSPILVGSLNPQRAALFFDLRIHGWDGECSEPGPAHARPIGKLKQFACPSCAGRLFQTWAAFEPSEVEELDEPEMQQRPQDFFTWFTLAAACASCQWTGIVASIECA